MDGGWLPRVKGSAYRLHRAIFMHRALAWNPWMQHEDMRQNFEMQLAETSNKGSLGVMLQLGGTRRAREPQLHGRL